MEEACLLGSRSLTPTLAPMFLCPGSRPLLAMPSAMALPLSFLALFRWRLFAFVSVSVPSGKLHGAGIVRVLCTTEYLAIASHVLCGVSCCHPRDWRVGCLLSAGHVPGTSGLLWLLIFLSVSSMEKAVSNHPSFTNEAAGHW